MIILDNSTNLKNVTKFVHSVDINTLLKKEAGLVDINDTLNTIINFEFDLV